MMFIGTNEQLCNALQHIVDTPSNGATIKAVAQAAILVIEGQQDHCDKMREALSVYADGCDATETASCGYEGNMCCMTAREALAPSA